MGNSLYHDVLNSSTSQGLKDDLRRAEIVVANNVSEFFFQTSDKEEWDITCDFPNLAPPFEKTWFEWNYPHFSNSGGKIVKFDSSDFTGMRCGVFVSSTHVEQGGFSGWACVAKPVAGRSGQIISVDIAYLFNVRDDGRLYPYDKNHNYVVVGNFSKQQLAQIGDSIVATIGPALLTTSFMHCQNVEIVERGPQAHPGARSRHGPRIKYYTLEIEPMKRILRTEGRGEKTGLKRALHICRGHFVHYTDKGLFGKLFGTFWVGQHLRGSSDQGIVIKDYDVRIDS